MSSAWFKARSVIAAVSIAATLTIAGSAAQAAKPLAAPSGSCSVAGSVVSAAGLPTDQLVNFLANDASGSWGWVIGYTADGTLSVTVPAPNGPATYQFVSRTWGPNGSKYTVFATCSA